MSHGKAAAFPSFSKIGASVRRKIPKFPDAIPNLSPWLWLSTIYAVMLAFHGIGDTDVPDWLRITPNTFQLVPPVNRQFLYSSPINFMIGDFLGLPTVFGYFLIHIAEIIAMLGVILICVRKKLPDRHDQIRFLSLLSLTPLWLITMKWIGKPDPLLIGTMFLCWAYPGRWRWMFASMLVIAHREMGTFMCAFLFLSEEKKDYSLILPILIGDTFHYLYENQWLDQKPASRVDDVFVNIMLHPREVLERPVLYFIASFSWYWIVLLWQRPAARLCIALTGVLTVGFICEDFTRDVILMALAPILFHLETVAKTRSSYVLMRFVPLGLLQIQVAAMGVVFKTNNVWVDWATGHLKDQLLK